MSREKMFFMDGKNYAFKDMSEDVRVLISDVIATEKELETMAALFRSMRRGNDSAINRIRKLLPDPVPEQPPETVSEAAPSDIKVEISDATVMDDKLEH